MRGPRCFIVSAAGDQRLAMYIVISKPNRKSVAAGVSHFMSSLLGVHDAASSRVTSENPLRHGWSVRARLIRIINRFWIHGS